MSIDNRFNIKQFVYEFLCCVLMAAAAYPGMRFTGKFTFQIVLGVLCALVFSVAADVAAVKPKQLAHAVCFTLAFWTAAALVKQMIMKKTLLFFLTPWEYSFYYDSVGMVFIDVIVVTLYQRIKAFIKKDSDFSRQYNSFYSVVSVAFSIFYLLVMIYCFFIIRSPKSERPEPNFSLFEAFRWTFLRDEIYYESLILFFGNIAFFVPPGYLLYHRFKNKKIVLVLLPIVLSVSIEAFQYFFKMGHADIDDVVLNVLGFYLGVALKILFDKVFKLKKAA